MASYDYTFTSGDTVTPTKLNNARTISDIVNADIKSDAAIALSKLATGALPTAITVASANLTYDNGPTGGFRNRIINGNIDIWQRGTSFSTSAYGADRWAQGFVGNTVSVSRQAFTLGQTDVPSEPTYFWRAAVTSVAGAGNYALLAQNIEDARTLAGQSATVSFYAKADAAKPIAIEFIQNFGTGGSPSSTVTAIGSQKFNLTTAWQKFTATVSVPSISGKTLGSDQNHYLGINFWLDAGSGWNSRTNTLGQQSGTFDIAQVQVEQGSVATPFEQRPIGTELALCQRYYHKITGSPIIRALNFASVSTDIYAAYQLPVTMRATPTLTATGDINDGAAFTTWNSLISGGFSSILFQKSSVPSGNFLDIQEITASAEL